LGPSSHRARARVGPMTRLPSLSWAAGDRRVPMARRASTQSALWPRKRAMAEGVSPSSWMSEQTTLPSSRAVTVRGGALACRSSRLCSAGEAGCSTTTGTVLLPSSRQRSRRLNPSMTSKAPSSVGATRSGIWASDSGCVGPRPGRRSAKRVRSRSMGSQQTVPARGSAVSGAGSPEERVLGRGSDMRLPRRRPPSGRRA
jgi:hypothetical protein